MRDIKERVRDKNPKIRNPAARLPKELVRQTVLEAKEKPRELQGKNWQPIRIPDTVWCWKK